MAGKALMLRTVEAVFTRLMEARPHLELELAVAGPKGDGGS